MFREVKQLAQGNTASCSAPFNPKDFVLFQPHHNWAPIPCPHPRAIRLSPVNNSLRETASALSGVSFQMGEAWIRTCHVFPASLFPKQPP